MDWLFDSFPQYLTLAEKQELSLQSWIGGSTGYYTLLVWRCLGALSLLFFTVAYEIYSIQYGWFITFKYLTTWG
jgi:hypothetical protein